VKGGISRIFIPGVSTTLGGVNIATSSSDNIFTRMLVNGSTLFTVELSSASSSNVLKAVTTVNTAWLPTGDGIRVADFLYTSIVNLATANNSSAGLEITNGGSSNLVNLAVGYNDNGIVFSITSNNQIQGILAIGFNLTQDCDVTAGTDPGLTDLTCGVNGTSMFTPEIGANLTNSFVGKVTTDDIINVDDSNGSASFPVSPGSFDWLVFDNDSRNWGLDGSAFPNADHQGAWTSGTGRIWDWSLCATDNGGVLGGPAMLNVIGQSDGDDAVTHFWTGTPISNDNAGCDVLVSGSVWNGMLNLCSTTFLMAAREIPNDGIGNDNLLCESDETCQHLPNMGAYQGHNGLVAADPFIDGELTGITLMRHASNGY
jgi:hypothetical protein